MKTRFQNKKRKFSQEHPTREESDTDTDYVPVSGVEDSSDENESNNDTDSDYESEMNDSVNEIATDKNEYTNILPKQNHDNDEDECDQEDDEDDENEGDDGDEEYDDGDDECVCDECDEDDDDECDEDDDECDEDDEEEIKKKLRKDLINVIKNADIVFESNPNTSQSIEQSKVKSLQSTLQKDELVYFNELDKCEQDKFSKLYEETMLQNSQMSVPLKFKILNSNMDPFVKSTTLDKFSSISKMEKSSGEYNKHNNYIQKLCKIPFGSHIKFPVSSSSTIGEIKQFMNKTSTILNNEVYGHDQAKDQIMRIVAQWVSNPGSKGNVIGIHGNPGVGKTTLIKDGVCKALGLPFAFVPLGGASDSSYLSGHSFTYEGSACGKIVELLIQTNCMNPVIYFDELDKISDTSRGKEIINLLIHMTDPSQNESFFDNYFANVPIDLSKCLFIFTYNHDELINPILKDRMITIHTQDYTNTDKLQISKQFLIPSVRSSFNMNYVDIDDQTIEYVIKKTAKESGVRNLRRSFESIISNLNIDRLNESQESEIHKVTKEHVDKYIKTQKEENPSLSHLYT
jgi:ATP-dependent Lon protease